MKLTKSIVETARVQLNQTFQADMSFKEISLPSLSFYTYPAGINIDWSRGRRGRET